MASYLITPDSDNSINTAKLQTALRIAFKYASGTSPKPFTPGVQTRELQLPKALQKSLEKWARKELGDQAGGFDIQAILCSTGSNYVGTAGDQPQHTLLTVPPEIRNRVYRQVLLREDVPIVKADEPIIQEPAMLRTCRQIRREALAIYYQENVVRFVISDFDASTYIRWCHTSEPRRQAECVFEVKDSQHWENLMPWLKAYYDGTCDTFNVIGRDRGTKDEAAYIIFENLQLLQNQKVNWSDIQQVLENTFVAFRALGR